LINFPLQTLAEYQNTTRQLHPNARQLAALCGNLVTLTWYSAVWVGRTCPCFVSLFQVV